MVSVVGEGGFEPPYPKDRIYNPTHLAALPSLHECRTSIQNNCRCLSRQNLPFETNTCTYRQCVPVIENEQGSTQTPKRPASRLPQRAATATCLGAPLWFACCDNRAPKPRATAWAAVFRSEKRSCAACCAGTHTRATQQSAPLQATSAQFMGSLVPDGAPHQGVVLKTRPLPNADLKTVCKRLFDEPGLVVVLDQVGGITRDERIFYPVLFGTRSGVEIVLIHSQQVTSSRKSRGHVGRRLGLRFFDVETFTFDVFVCVITNLIIRILIIMLQLAVSTSAISPLTFSLEVLIHSVQLPTS